MTPETAQQLLAQMVAMWPDANLPETTVRLWLDRLKGVSIDAGWYAVQQCEKSCKRFPALAEFHQAVSQFRAHDRNALPPAPDVPADPVRAKAFLDQARVILLAKDRKVLLASDLDRAGVRDWQDRLSRARHADNSGEAYDREWAAIKREYAALERGEVVYGAPFEPDLTYVRDPSGTT